MLLFFFDWPHCQTDDQIAPRASFADGRSVLLLPHSFSWQNSVRFMIYLDTYEKRIDAMTGYAFNYKGIFSHSILGVVLELFSFGLSC